MRVPAALKSRLDEPAAIRKGKKDVREGRVAPHEKAARWLRSWGKEPEVSPPSCE